MPCQAPPEITYHEREADKIVKLTDELNGAGPVDPETYGIGFDRRVYLKIRNDLQLNTITAHLCARLHKIDDVTKYSLELQIWWRDHQKFDEANV